MLSLRSEKKNDTKLALCIAVPRREHMLAMGWQFKICCCFFFAKIYWKTKPTKKKPFQFVPFRLESLTRISLVSRPNVADAAAAVTRRVCYCLRCAGSCFDATCMKISATQLGKHKTHACSQYDLYCEREMERMKTNNEKHNCKSDKSLVDNLVWTVSTCCLSSTF